MTTGDNAELIRTCFVEASHEVDGYPVAATLSIGIAFSKNGPLDVPALLMQAGYRLGRCHSQRAFAPPCSVLRNSVFS